jgi:hypothetical protein
MSIITSEIIFSIPWYEVHAICQQDGDCKIFEVVEHKHHILSHNYEVNLKKICFIMVVFIIWWQLRVEKDTFFHDNTEWTAADW